MKKGVIYTGTIKKTAFPNKSTVVSDGFSAVIKGGIPGQKVNFVLKKVRAGKCAGRLIEVTEKSAIETAEPVCPHFGTCGGCTYQTLPYETQLELKKNQVRELIDPVIAEVYNKTSISSETPSGLENATQESTQDETLCGIENALQESTQDETLCGLENATQESTQDETLCSTENVLQESTQDNLKDKTQNDDNEKYRDQIDSLYEGIIPSPQVYEYRNKMEFSFGDEVINGPLRLGLHKKGSFHDIIDADGCKIVHDDFSKIIRVVKSYAENKSIPHYNKKSHEGVLRYLLVRRSTTNGQILAAIVTSSQGNYEFDDLCDQVRKIDFEGKLTGFIHIVDDDLADALKCDSMKILYGEDYITENILNLEFKISIFSFFQTNTLGAERLYEQARRYVIDGVQKSDNLGNPSLRDKDDSQKFLKGKTVFDLYSGTGTIAQMLAPVSGKVIGVEIIESAVEAARENAKINKLENCEFIAGDVLKVIDDIKDKPDFIVLDPPREGINPKALKKIIDYGVESIVYISCKPTSLANDLKELQESGYRVIRYCNVDMFPGTVHVETVVLMSRVKE